MSKLVTTTMLRAPLISVASSIVTVAGAAADVTNVSGFGQMAAAEQATEDVARAFPAIFGAASAVAPAGGAGYFALTYANPRNGIAGSGADGDLVAGYTFGNPVDAVSVSVGVAITGLDPFADSGSMFISGSRLIGSTDSSATFIGVSALGLGGWGDAVADRSSFNIYGSHLTSVSLDILNLPVQMTLGYGTQTTLSTDGFAQVGDGFFYGIGAGLTEALSISVSGTATQVNAGAVLSIPGIEGLSISAGIFDILDRTDRQQATATAAYSF